MNSLSLSQLISKYAEPKKAVLAIVLLVIANKIRSNAAKSALASKFLRIAQEKRKQRDLQIASEYISPNEIPEEIRTLILDSTVAQLSQLLNDDKITSEQILKTYHSRAITLGLSLELIADSNYKEALQLARQCDETRRNTKPEDRHTLGALFGIPISIKDSFIQKGLDATIGGAPHCFSPIPEDGAILAVLKSRGAIPFIKSNVPQTLAVLDCVNHIWGRSVNPWSKDRTVGGSSGGEGGLVAARCSPIGLGSDALGSIRIPAAFNGVTGFKPTMGRYLTKGHTRLGPYSTKYNFIYPNNGPITRTVEDAVLFTKALISEEGREFDPLSPYVPWNEDKFQSEKKLRIAYTLSEDFFGASKASQRAVRETVENLKKQGHELIESKIPGFERIALLVLMITSSEGKGRGILKVLAGEAPIKELQNQLFVKALPTFIKKAFRFLFSFKGYDRLAKILEMTEEVTVDEFYEKVHEYFQRKDELLKFFLDNKIDAFITPSMPFPAIKHGHGMELALGSCYNWLANVANLPAGTVPVTLVKEGEDVYTLDECVHNDRMFKHCQDSIKGSVGLPIGVQVMTLPWEDEKCLAIMKAIESQANFKGLQGI